MKGFSKGLFFALSFLVINVKMLGQYDFGNDKHFQRDQNLKYSLGVLQKDSIQVFDYILAIEAKKSFLRNQRSNYRGIYHAIEFLDEVKPFHYCPDSGTIVLDIYITTGFGGEIVKPSKVEIATEHSTLFSECISNSALNAVKEFSFYIPRSSSSRADLYQKKDLFIGSFKIEYPITDRLYFDDEASELVSGIKLLFNSRNQ